jgi:Peptide methionine sulfoxide reductase
MESANKKNEKAYLASGCFWGTQYHLNKAFGVASTFVGYMGGNLKTLPIPKLKPDLPGMWKQWK